MQCTWFDERSTVKNLLSISGTLSSTVFSCGNVDAAARIGPMHLSTELFARFIRCLRPFRSDYRPFASLKGHLLDLQAI